MTLLQTDIKWCSPKENILNAKQEIERTPNSDLYILPEMFSTGFCMTPEDIAEPKEGEAFTALKEIAIGKSCAIVASIPTIDEGNYYNMLYFIFPDGSYTTYSKKHLFSFSGEDKIYTAGNKRKIIEYRGVRILPLICYDLRFPVFMRNRGDYDMIICIANWPEVRRSPWVTLSKARAIENQCYVAAVNRAGEDKWGRYSGDTKLIDPYGNPIAECEDFIQNSITGNIDLDMLNQFREKFPALNDADDFILR